MRNALRALVLLCLGATVAAGCASNKKLGEVETRLTTLETAAKNAPPGELSSSQLKTRIDSALAEQSDAFKKDTAAQIAAAVKNLSATSAGKDVATKRDVEMLATVVQKLDERTTKLEAGATAPKPATPVAAPVAKNADLEVAAQNFKDGNTGLAWAYVQAMRSNFSGDDEAFVGALKAQKDDKAFLDWVTSCLKASP